MGSNVRRRRHGRRSRCVEPIDVYVGIVPEDTSLLVRCVELDHAGPDAVPALLFLELQRKRCVSLRPAILPRERCRLRRSRSIRLRPAANLEGFVGECDRRGVRDCQADVGRAVGTTGVEDGGVALERLGDPTVVRVVTNHQDLVCAAV